MIDNGIKLLLMPPGGWFYEQAIEGSNPIRIEGQTYQQLENRVFQFRLDNLELVPTGSATREIVRDNLRIAICSRAPSQCTGDWTPSTPRQKASPETGYRPPIERIEDWFKKLTTVEIRWKDASRANAAAEVCTSCPQNVPWKVGCAPCVEAIETRIHRIRGDRQTVIDGQLRACRIFGHHNQLAVWMNPTFSEAKETPPEACWNAS